MKKKLLFNLEKTQPSGDSKRHGGGIYGEIVFRKIVERGLPVEAVYDSSKWLNPEMEELCRKGGIVMHDLAQSSMQEIVDRSGADVFYSPLLDRSFNDLRCVDKIFTVHGLRDLELPADPMSLRYRGGNLKQRVKRRVIRWMNKTYHRKMRERWVGLIAGERTRYVTVSNHSLSSIRLFLTEYRGRATKVFYSPDTATVDPSAVAKHEGAPYFLLVSGNRWEKNNLRAIMALDRLYSEGLIGHTRTIITGAKSADIYRYKLRNPEKFEFKGYVDDRELAALYRDAFCFIYPTLNEGFGYPPLEAMRFGVPVLASPVTSVAEVCGDGAVFFNPYDIDELQMRIIQILDPEFHQEMSRRGRSRFEKVRDRQHSDLDQMVDFLYSE